MAATPKNPFNGGGSIQGMPNQTIAPKVPTYDGGQYARDSMTPEELYVARDEYWNERASDDPTAKNCTPMHSNPLYQGRQFDTIVTNPSDMQYGARVIAAPKATSIAVRADDANRGKES